MPPWFRPVFKLLLFANGVGLVGLLVGLVQLPPSGTERPWPASPFDWRPLLPILLSFAFLLVSWWCSRWTGRGHRLGPLAAKATLAVATVLTLSGFASGPWPDGPFGNSARSGSVVILAVNDVYRIEGLDGGKTGGLARLRTLRADLERSHPGRVLLLHGGDVIFPSLASRVYKGQQMIDVLNLMDGDPRPGWLDERMFVVFGNHEFDEEDCSRDSVLQRRVTESDFYWLRSNVGPMPCPRDRPGLAGDNLLDSRIVKVGRLRVGVFGLTIDSETEGLPFRFKDARETAKALVADLRKRGADVVVAVTHLNFNDDLRLYEALRNDGLNLIIGGHDHVHMSLPKDEPRIFKADADAATAWVITLTRHADGRVEVAERLQPLRANVGKDPVVDGRVKQWMRAHDAAFCHTAAVDPHWVGDKPPDPVTCLDKPLGETMTPLVASEERIRSSETSAGNWVTDEMVAAFAACGVDGAFINAGALRLNQDLPEGSKITLRHLEELIGFPTVLRVYKLTHQQLREALTNAVSKPRDGRWLQVSDQLAFIYQSGDDERGVKPKILKAAVRPPGKPPIEITESKTATLRIVINEFLASEKSKDDFRAILKGTEETSCTASGSDLKQLLYSSLQKQGRIKPEPQGRICTDTESREHVCRADQWVK